MSTARDFKIEIGKLENKARNPTRDVEEESETTTASEVQPCITCNTLLSFTFTSKNKSSFRVCSNKYFYFPSFRQAQLVKELQRKRKVLKTELQRVKRPLEAIQSTSHSPVARAPCQDKFLPLRKFLNQAQSLRQLQPVKGLLATL